MSTRAEDRIAAKIDRDRNKVATSARALQVRELAKSQINCAVLEMPANDQPEFMRAAIHHLRHLYGKATDEASAVALFGSMAHSKDLNLKQAIAKATAEKLFAANDAEKAA